MARNDHPRKRSSAPSNTAKIFHDEMLHLMRQIMKAKSRR